MANDWNPPKYTVDDVNEFIIPDEEIPSGSNSGNNGSNYASNSNSYTNTNTSSNIFSQFGFVPKVDLSSTFASFTTVNENLSVNNRVKERQFTGGDTLDEPILETLKRDASQIVKRLFIVIWPMQLSALASKQQQNFLRFAQSNGIRVPELINQIVTVPENEESTGMSNDELIKFETLDWDLWGPLIFSLLFSVALGFSANNDQTTSIFSGSFSFIWIFYFVIGLNIQLLGGSISFMSAISAAGYSMFPIVLGELLCSLLIKWKIIRLVLMIVLNLWSIYVGQMSLKCSGVLPGRVLLAIYPVALMYSTLSWLVVIT